MKKILVTIVLAMLGASAPAQTDTPSVPPLEEPAPAQVAPQTQSPAQPTNPIPTRRPRRSATAQSTAQPTPMPATATPSRRTAPAAKKAATKGSTAKGSATKRRATQGTTAGVVAQGQVTRRPTASRKPAAAPAEAMPAAATPVQADPAQPALPALDGGQDPALQAPAPVPTQFPDQAQPQAPGQAQAPDQAQPPMQEPAPEATADAAARAREAQAEAAIPQNFKLDVRLERIRVQRTRGFSRSSETDPAEEAQWGNEMAMQIKVNPPREWDVISIDHASIQQVLDQNGQPLPQVQQVGALNPTSGAPDLNPMEPLFRKVDGGALLLLRMSSPPSETQAFKTIDARIQTKLGYRRDLIVDNLRARKGQNFLRSTGVNDLVMEVSDINDDMVEVMALGALDRVGPMTFTDNAGKPVNPYNTEVITRDAQAPGANRGKVWRFAFSKVPAGINMNLTLYRIVSPRNITVKFTNVPLP